MHFALSHHLIACINFIRLIFPSDTILSIAASTHSLSWSAVILLTSPSTYPLKSIECAKFTCWWFILSPVAYSQKYTLSSQCLLNGFAIGSIVVTIAD